MEGELKRVDTIARVRRAFHVQGWSVKKIVRERLRHRGGHAVEAIERPGITHKAPTFSLEHLPDRLSRLFRVAMGLGIGNAFVE